EPPEPKPRSYLERTGSRYMGLVLIVICGFIFVFLMSWWCTRPSLHDAAKLVEMTRAEGQSKVVEPQALGELLAKMQQEHSSNYRDFFQLLVMSGLVPLFTLLAGYVFGKETGKREEAPPGG